MNEKKVSMEDKTKMVIQQDTILYFVYLLYATNQITRHHIKHILEVIKKPMPENLMEYFVKEVGKI